METKALMRLHLESLRRQYGEAASILNLMEKTAKPEVLTAMREEKLGPLSARIREFEEMLKELDDEDWWKA